MRNQLIILFAFLICSGCTTNDEYIFDHAFINSGAKKFIDYYIDYSDLPESMNEISIYNRISNSDTIYYISSGRLSNFSVKSARKDSDYSTKYRNYQIFISKDLKNIFFREKGNIILEKELIIFYDEDFIPLTEDISIWEFQVINHKIANFKFKFCKLSQKEVNEIEEITLEH